MIATFPRGVVVLSLDTEQIWGHLDLMGEWEYHRRFPDTTGAYDRLLAALTTAGISATWFIVGGLTLDSWLGASDPRLAKLPEYWRRHIPAGSEASRPVWFRRSFAERLRDATPRQEIGLHGGLTHLIWTDPRAGIDHIRAELTEGLRALNQLRIFPQSLSFPRDQERYHSLLPLHGIRCFRGRTPTLDFRLGRNLAGSALRALSQLSASTPPPVWPEQVSPGLWNLPSSAFLYPIGVWRSRVIPMRTRLTRFARGIEAASRLRGVFHFSFHPANLTECAGGFALLEEMLRLLLRARESGDIEILTVADLIARVDTGRTAVPDQAERIAAMN